MRAARQEQDRQALRRAVLEVQDRCAGLGERFLRAQGCAYIRRALGAVQELARAGDYSSALLRAEELQVYLQATWDTINALQRTQGAHDE